MTETDWLQSTHPAPMVWFLRRASYRKVRLLACACCHRAATYLDTASAESLAVAERFCDGETSANDLRAAMVRAQRAADVARLAAPRTERAGGSYAACSAVALACDADINRVVRAIGLAAQSETEGLGLARTIRLIRAHYEQVPLVQDVFGNPFRPAALDRAWLTSTVVALARGIYAERAFDRLPILADALMDAGCDDDDILNHCRGDDPHMRGCWVVDRLLGRK